MKTIRIKSILCFALLLMMSSTGSHAQNAADLQSQIAAKYESLSAMSASFVQVTTSEFLDAPERFSGILLFSGSMYKIQTSSQHIVTDSHTLWIHNRAERQVIINDFVEDESSFSLTSLLQQIGSDYSATLLGQVTKQGVRFDQLELVPKDINVQFKRVLIDSRTLDRVVTRVEVLDYNDVQMVFDLADIVLNPVISNEVFAFTPPAGVEIIDLRN